MQQFINKLSVSIFGLFLFYSFFSIFILNIIATAVMKNFPGGVWGLLMNQDKLENDH